MGKVSIEVLKAFLVAGPAYIMMFWKMNRIKSEKTLEQMQDCIDWDAEYEALLTEEDRKKPKAPKLRKKQKKARK